MAPVINLDVLVSRPSGGALNLNNGTTYKVIQWFDPLVGERREEEVTGKYQAGSMLLSSVPDTETIRMVVRVQGSTWVAQAAAARVMILALTQFKYQITVDREGEATIWRDCRPARINYRENVDSEYRQHAFTTKRGRAEYAITIRCNPNVVVED